MNDQQGVGQNGRNAAVAEASPDAMATGLQNSTVRAEYIWLDGELVPFEQATVHVLSPTLHYGPGAFEGIRCYGTPRGPAIFRLQEHLERFLNSIRVLGVRDIRHDTEELRDVICRVIRANRLNECYVRPLLFFEGPLGLNLDAYRPVIGVAAWEWEPLLGREALESGIRAMVSSLTRIHPNASMTKAKINGQYVNSIMAKTMAARAGFDEAIMLDPEGYVADCTGENLFLVRGDVIFTSPSATILEGITRDSVLTLARDEGYSVVEERISRDQMYIADEVFLCGTAAEVVAVREIDHRVIGDGWIGPVTLRLQKLFLDTVRGGARRSVEWLDYMVMEPLV